MKKKYNIGSSTTLIFLIIIVAILGTFLSLINFEGSVTTIDNGYATTSTVSIESVFTQEGFRTFFSNIIMNFRLLEPLALLIVSLIGISICEQSGLLRAKSEKLKKFKPSVITFMVLLTGMVFSFFGDYGYLVLLPTVGIIYKYLGRSSMLGIITAFIGMTIGTSTGFFYNYESYQLGILTQLSANTVLESTHIFSSTSNIIIMISSALIFLFCLTSIIENHLEYRFDKPEKIQDNFVLSKLALKYTNIALLIMVMVFALLIVPGRAPLGILLDNTQELYIAKLFSEASPFAEGMPFIITIIMMVCGLVYGKVSGNIKNSEEYNKGLSISFSRTGYVFVLMFFISILTGIINYTHIDEVICVNLVELLGSSNFTGVLLIILLFVITFIISLIMPSTIAKWVLMSPVVVPLFMKANVSPSFSQFIFTSASSISRCITPFFTYFIIMIGFMEKYNTTNEKINIIAVIKMLSKVIVLITVIWLLILVGWYIVGLPTGISTYPTL